MAVATPGGAAALCRRFGRLNVQRGRHAPVGGQMEAGDVAGCLGRRAQRW
jgi:hypothetical protein